MTAQFLASAKIPVVVILCSREWNARREYTAFPSSAATFRLFARRIVAECLARLMAGCGHRAGGAAGARRSVLPQTVAGRSSTTETPHISRLDLKLCRIGPLFFWWPYVPKRY
jgi:hypothetical protein